MESSVKFHRTLVPHNKTPSKFGSLPLSNLQDIVCGSRFYKKLTIGNLTLYRSGISQFIMIKREEAQNASI